MSTMHPTYHFLSSDLLPFSIKAEIIYLPAYYPSEEEKANPELYANNVRKKMAEVLGVPTTNHTIADAIAKQERKDAPIKPDALTKAAVA